MQFTKEELDAVLKKHEKWSRCEEGGERAHLNYAYLNGVNLSDANLIGADLHDTNLSNADLSNADLRRVDLSGADLSFTNLRHVDLSGANLRYAYLNGVDLSDAKLIGADLSGTDLSGAHLSGARGLPPICCPEEGSFVGWKKCVNPFNFARIVKLLIPEDARRSSATGRKCRCDKALVLGFYDLEGNRLPVDVTALSYYDPFFQYHVGETVSVPDFDENRWNECAPGIHFFITRQEAIDYVI